MCEHNIPSRNDLHTFPCSRTSECNFVKESSPTSLRNTTLPPFSLPLNSPGLLRLISLTFRFLKFVYVFTFFYTKVYLKTQWQLSACPNQKKLFF